MKIVLFLALVGLLTHYVSGRAIIIKGDEMEDAAPAVSVSYDQCMMDCEDAEQECLSNVGNGEFEASVTKREDCKAARGVCETGSSANDADLPAYKRVYKRSCADSLERSDSVDSSSRNDINFDFIMQQ